MCQNFFKGAIWVRTIGPEVQLLLPPFNPLLSLLNDPPQDTQSKLVSDPTSDFTRTKECPPRLGRGYGTNEMQQASFLFRLCNQYSPCMKYRGSPLVSPPILAAPSPPPFDSFFCFSPSVLFLVLLFFSEGSFFFCPGPPLFDSTPLRVPPSRPSFFFLPNLFSFMEA